MGTPMRARANRGRRAPLDRVGEESGWTLIELLVAMAIFTFVLGAALSLFEVSVKSAPKEQERAAAIQEAQTGLSGMTREIRDANEIFELSPSVIDFTTVRQGVQTHVRYECGVTDPEAPASTPPLLRCQRSQGTVATPMPALGTPRTVIGRMLNGSAADPVFAYTTPPQDPLDDEDDPLDVEGAVLCTPPATSVSGYCLPAPWPTYIDVKVKVPAKGRLPKGGYSHSVSYSDAVYLRNLEARQSPYNSGG